MVKSVRRREEGQREGNRDGLKRMKEMKIRRSEERSKHRKTVRARG